MAFSRHTAVMVVWQLVHLAPARLLTFWGEQECEGQCTGGWRTQEVRVRVQAGLPGQGID